MQQMPNLQSLIGKTIKDVDDSATNCIKITCTDGSVTLLEAENILPSIGLIGIIPYRIRRARKRAV